MTGAVYFAAGLVIGGYLMRHAISNETIDRILFERFDNWENEKIWNDPAAYGDGGEPTRTVADKDGWF